MAAHVNFLVSTRTSLRHCWRHTSFPRNSLLAPSANFEWKIPQRSLSITQTLNNADVLVTVEDKVRKITLNRPSKKNAVNADMLKTVLRALKEGENDDNTNIIAITGTGDFFTAGMDLKNFRSPSSSPKNENSSEQPKKEPKKRTGFEFKATIYPFIDCRKPILALVNGPSHGFGVTMLGLFDSVWASDQATFQTRFTQYSVPPEFGSTYTFPKIMGPSKASYVLLANQKLTAEEAYSCGLVSRIFPHNEFHSECDKLLKKFAQLPVKSLIYSKDLVRGRERNLLKEVNVTEQSYFDPEAAREVKRKFAEGKLESQ